ncbi:hypothetical protein [Streptomyces aureus]|uniref:Uncharacterized protein n=1 Tax=Streptomyces aureus TaxID=193461 RepID=A0ABV4SHR4_9ACTN
MTGDLIAAAILATPGVIFATVTLSGHARARRADDALAHALMTTPEPGGPGPGEPQPVPESAGTPQAIVLDFTQHRRARTLRGAANTPERNAA